MKILIFAGGFFPGKTFGGPPVSVDNFCSLMTAFDCFIVTSDHDNGNNNRYKGIEEGWNERGNAKVLYLSDKEYFSVKKLNEITKEIKPDVIYLQSLFQDLAMLGLIVAKKNGIRVMLAPRGELCAGAFRKKYKKLPYIALIKSVGLLKNTHFQSTSAEETEAIIRFIKAPYNKIHLLTNIHSIPQKEYRHIEKKTGEAKFIFLSRIHPKKNLDFAIDCMKSIDGEVRFDIYGPIEDREYWAKCQETIQQLPSSVNVRYCGLIQHDKVHEIFSHYDAFIFPTLSENYGHVIIESMLSGCIPIISDKTPWSDLSDFNAGWALPLDNQGEFTKAIKQIIQYDNCQIEEKRLNIKNYIDNRLCLSDIKKEYEMAFGSIISNNII